MLAEGGCNVVIADIDIEEAKLVSEGIKKLGCESIAVKVDVSDNVQVNEMVKKVLDKFGRIDILVNNAGYLEIVPITEMTVDQWDRMMAVHLRGTFNCSKAVIPSMIKQGSGRIINLSSISGQKVGGVGWSHYCAAKAGIAGFTKALAIELAPHKITVNALGPGGVATRLQRVDKMKEIGRELIPLKRWAHPREQAYIAAFLASDEAGFMTGEVVYSDGGEAST